MDLPHIHSCLQLNAENENLRRKIHRLKKEKQTIKRKLEEWEEKKRVETLLKDYVTTREVYVQTEPSKNWPHSGYGQTRRKEDKPKLSEELEKTNKVLSMHSQLMKRYEKEVKTNMGHVETISTLNYRIVELERKCKEEEVKVKQLHNDKVALQKQVISSRSSNEGHDQSLNQSKACTKTLKEDLKKLKAKCEKYAEQNKRLKFELKGLDPGFFDEVEDIKYALRQSAKLNREYERTLRKLCQQYAVPYPNPEKILEER